MHIKQPWLSLMIGIGAALAVTAVSAVGLGSGGSSAVLGQPLDFVVQVRLEAGETLDPACVSAEVTSGDRRFAPAQVRALVEMTGPETARVRIVTQPGIDEPVIGIQLFVGCKARISRRYVVLADPPNTALAPTAPAFAGAPAPVPETPATDALPQPAQAVNAVPAVNSVASSNPMATAAAQERQVRRRSERRAAARAVSSRPPSQAKVAARNAQGAQAAARLQLEFMEPPRSAEAVAVEGALAAVAQAASAARDAASAAAASAVRMAELERAVEQLRSEARSNSDLAAQFRQRLSETEAASVWMLPLLVFTGILAALAAWLAWRLGRAQTVRQSGWRDAAELTAPATEASPSRQSMATVPFITSEQRQPPSASTTSKRSRSAPAWPPPAPAVAWPAPNSTQRPDEPQTKPGFEPTAEAAMQITQPQAATGLPNAGAPRDVSIEELIDLEQQADFFIVLGQDDAAIDLLVEHLRSTGGGSPLPYLKLLEIHRRRDEREDYERLRTRFNHRFNAYAPDWGVDLGHGRTLDDYADVIPQLQRVWKRPLDAMAELEALLFRKSRGELFDLPAYREVLFLYSLARDLLDRAASDAGNVDLLLPMAKGGDAGGSAPATSPYQGLERNAFRDTMPPEEVPSTVDFDLSASERPSSIFGLLDEAPPPRPRS